MSRQGPGQARHLEVFETGDALKCHLVDRGRVDRRPGVEFNPANREIFAEIAELDMNSMPEIISDRMGMPTPGLWVSLDSFLTPP